MRHTVQLAVLLTIVLMLPGRGLGQGQTNPERPKPDSTRPEPSLMGGWRAESVSMAMADGKRKTLSPGDGPISVIVSEKMFTMRLGAKVLSEMSYTLDATQTPRTIDLKSPDGAMLGICKVDGGRLRMALNDAAQGRPADISQESCGLVLLLRRVEGGPLWIINADGTGLREFFASPEYTDTGTPAWSPDGGKVVFDSIRSLFGEEWGHSRLVVVDSAGGATKDLGIGVMPSWSPDGRRIAFTGISGDRRGMCTVSADGTDLQQLVANALWAKWSPKADELAYTTGGGLWVYDVKTQKTHALLTQERSISYGFNWSPDGQWICFLSNSSREGNHRNEVAIVHREGQEKGLRVLLPWPVMPDVTDINCNFAWERPEGKRILASLATRENANHQLYLLDAEGKAAPQRIPGQDPKRSCSNGTWSPDGKQIIFCVRPGNAQEITTVGP